jgi:hypothetical protein
MEASIVDELDLDLDLISPAFSRDAGRRQRFTPLQTTLVRKMRGEQ